MFRNGRPADVVTDRSDRVDCANAMSAATAQVDYSCNKLPSDQQVSFQLYSCLVRPEQIGVSVLLGTITLLTRLSNIVRQFKQLPGELIMLFEKRYLSQSDLFELDFEDVTAFISHVRDLGELLLSRTALSRKQPTSVGDIFSVSKRLTADVVECAIYVLVNV